MQFVLVLLIDICVLHVNSISNASNTEITIPLSGVPENSSILDTMNARFVITAMDSNGNLAGDSELFWVELNSKDTCEIGYGSILCQVLCYPFNEPHIRAKQCESSYYTKGRVEKRSDTNLWVISNVQSSGNSTYTVTYYESVEVSDNYIVTIYLLMNGGLYGRYWDNIWFTGVESYSEISSEINYQWGTDAAITKYGTDYISVRWEGKILPPYNETYTFYLYADDGSRLWIDKILIINGWNECCNETWGSVNLTSNTFYDIIIEYKEIRAEAYIELRWSSDSISKSIVPSTYLYYQQHIKNSPFDSSPIYVSPGNVSYQQTVVNDIQPFINNVAGINNSVYLTATDAFGHVLNTDTAIFNITNLDGLSSMQEWEGNGIYKITFMSLSKITDVGRQFFIQLNNNNILNSPYTVYVEPSVTSPLNSTLSGHGLVSGVAGYSANFNVTVYDVYGNERECDGDIISVRFYGSSAGHATCEYLIFGFGVYLCSYTLTKIGIYTPEITINNIILPYSSIINISTGLIHGPSCDIINIDQLNDTLLTGYVESIIIQSRDQFSNPTVSISDNYIINSNISLKNISITSIGSGRYNLTFIPLIVGIYKINILLNNQTHISNSPYIINVIPSIPTASTSYITSDINIEPIISNIETYFLLQLCDLYTNKLTSEPNIPNIDIDSVLSCHSNNISIECNYYINGQYKCKYTPIKSGLCILYVKISNINIINSPFSINIEPGEISSINTYISFINKTTIRTDTIGIIIIQSQDTNNNNLTFGGYTFSVSLIDKDNIYDNININENEIIDNLDGTYMIKYYHNIANIYEELNIKLINKGGLTGIYYNDYSFTNIFIDNIIDSIISFNWGYNIIETENILFGEFPLSDYFSIEWNGYLYPPYSETYIIYVSIESGSNIQLYINNNLLINENGQYGKSDPFISIQLNKNIFYGIKILFTEQTGKCKISLEWESNSIGNRIPIDSNYLYYIIDIQSVNISIIPSNTIAINTIYEFYEMTQLEPIHIAGKNNKITIIAKDIYNNIQTNSGNEYNQFKLYLTNDFDNSIINGTIIEYDSSNGKYIGQYIITNTSKQPYTLYITYNNINIYNSPYPYPINIVSGNLSIDESNIILYNGRAGELQTLLLFISDSYSNLIYDNIYDKIQIVFIHEITNHIYTTNNITFYENEAKYLITYNITLSGQYTVNITLNNTQSLNKNINISTAIASSSKSYIIGWSSNSINIYNNNTNIQKTIQLIDIYSNTILFDHGYNFYVILLQNLSSNIINQYIVTLSSNGTYNINITIPPIPSIYYLNVLLASGDKYNPDGLYGEFYNNRWLYSLPYNTQINTNISLNWGNGLITNTAKNFVSIRWTGYIKPQYAETYTFIIKSDDGSRLYVNNQLIFDNFLSNAGIFNGTYTFNINDLLYPIKIEYRENTGNANITLQWQSPSQSLQTIPQDVLFSTANHIKHSPFVLTVT